MISINNYSRTPNEMAQKIKKFTIQKCAVCNKYGIKFLKSLLREISKRFFTLEI
jgi:hypothetical protein